MTVTANTADRMPWALLASLALAYSLAFVDRAIVGLMMSDISRDLGISREYTSLLVGTGFALVYAVAGVLAAILLSRMHPRNTIALGIIVWSLATAACALARGPDEFLLARMLVGAGEATLVPAAYAWIPARTPYHRVGIAIACFTVGVALGSGLSLGFGGHLIQAISESLQNGVWLGLSSWRIILIALAIIGTPIALLVWRIDPAPVGYAANDVRSPWPDLRAPAWLFLGCACVISTIYLQLFWAHNFFAEKFGMDLASSALVVGIAVALGAVGAIGGGIVGDRLARAAVVLPHVAMMIAMNILQIAMFLVAFLVPSVSISVGAYMIAMAANGAIGATMGPAISQIFPSDRRAVAASICLAAGTGLGLGVFMPLVGAIARQLGIGIALLGGTTGLLVMSCAFLWSARAQRCPAPTSPAHSRTRV